MRKCRDADIANIAIGEIVMPQAPSGKARRTMWKMVEDRKVQCQ